VKAPEALDRILAGESVEAPPQVRELVELAGLLQGAWQGAPAPAVKGRARVAAMEAFVAAPATAPMPKIPARRTRGRRLVARMALVAALVAGVPTAAWAASENALPGELMYPVKRAIEEVRLVIAGDAADEARVLLGMMTDRVGEAAVAHALGRDDAASEALAGYDDALIRFRGRIVQARAAGLSVSGFLEQATDLEAAHQQVVLAISGPAPAVTEPAAVVPAPSAPETQGKANHGKVGGKNGGSGHHGPSKNSRGGGGSGGSSQTSGGGGGSAGGDGSSQEQQPPQSDGDDDQGEDEEGHGSGHSNGHEKAVGNGHHKHHGEGHDENG
jgi:uncharacterized membrane protein YgcG